MSDMLITQAAGSRNYSLHWRDGHGTWDGNHSGGIPAHPTVLGYMVGNHSTMPEPNTPHFNWGIDFPGTVTGIPTPLAPPFLGHFLPVLRRLFAVLLRFPAFWRQDGENGRKMA